MKVTFPLLASALTLVSGLPALAQTASSKQAYEHCKQASTAVVTIYAGTEIGSGSVITPDGVILTNHHVLKDAINSRGKKLIYVNFLDGGHYTARFIGQDVANDLALIRLNTESTFPTVPLAETVAVRPKEAVCAVGSPLGRRGVISQGTFDGARQNGDLRSQIYLYPGNSGGPLIDARGAMIGINKSIWEDEQGRNSGISFATSAPVARQFIAKSGIALAPTPIAQLPPPPTIANDVGGTGGLNSVAVSTQTATEAATIPDQPAAKEFIFTATPAPAEVPEPTLENPTSPNSDGRLGVIINTETLIIRQVELGTPADRAGLRPGDRLVAVNNAEISRFDQLVAFIQRRPATAVLTIRRGLDVLQVPVNFSH